MWFLFNIQLSRSMKLCPHTQTNEKLAVNKDCSPQILRIPQWQT